MGVSTDEVPGPEAPSPADSDAPSADALRRLVRAIRELAGAQDLAAVVEIVRHAAREVVSADGATFVLRDRDQCYYVDEDAIEPLWRGQRFPLETCISGWAMLHKQAVWIPDIYADDRIPHEAYRPTFVKSLAMTPIRTAEPLGSIGTYWADQHSATAAELEVLQALADSTSVALERIRVQHELEDRVNERTAALRASNRDLAAFAHVAAHDLKAPLSTIVGYAELALELEDGNLTRVGESALGTVRRQALRMGELIDAVLSYSTAATTPLALETVDFDALACNVVHDLQGLIESRQATVTVADLPVGCGEPRLLERVLQNLIVNAIIYGDPSAPQVLVTGKALEDSVTLTVTDNGQGVREDERESIFDMFVRGREASGSHGSGIGLAFSRRVLHRHGGTLGVEDAPEGGARFVLTLPLSPIEDNPLPVVPQTALAPPEVPPVRRGSGLRPCGVQALASASATSTRRPVSSSETSQSTRMACSLPGRTSGLRTGLPTETKRGPYIVPPRAAGSVAARSWLSAPRSIVIPVPAVTRWKNGPRIPPPPSLTVVVCRSELVRPG